VTIETFSLSYVPQHNLPLSSGISHPSYKIHFHLCSHTLFLLFLFQSSTLTFCIIVLYTVNGCILSPMFGNKRKYSTIKKVKKLNKKFDFSCHHPQSLLHYSDIIPGYKGLYSVKTMQLIANSWTPDELKNCKLKNPSLLFVPISRKRQATGFEPFRHM